MKYFYQYICNAFGIYAYITAIYFTVIDERCSND